MGVKFRQVSPEHVLEYLRADYGFIAAHLSARRPPAAVTFGDLTTFADLSRAVAAHCGHPEGNC